jgi:hypothetical protein
MAIESMVGTGAATEIRAVQERARSSFQWTSSAPGVEFTVIGPGRTPEVSTARVAAQMNEGHAKLRSAAFNTL